MIFHKMKNNILLGIVTLTSLLPVVLQVIVLDESPKNEEFIHWSIISISLLFVSMMLRGLIGRAWEEDLLKGSYNILPLFAIIGSISALTFSGAAYGANINDDTINVPLGFSVLSLLLSSFLGHFMKEEKEEEREYKAYTLSAVKMLLVVVSGILFLINLLLDTNVYENVEDITVFSILAFLFLAVSLSYSYMYMELTFNEGFRSLETTVSFICCMDNGMPVVEFYHSDISKKMRILSSAGSIAIFSILYGCTKTDEDLASAAILSFVAFIDHWIASSYAL